MHSTESLLYVRQHHYEVSLFVLQQTHLLAYYQHSLHSTQAKKGGHFIKSYEHFYPQGNLQASKTVMPSGASSHFVFLAGPEATS